MNAELLSGIVGVGLSLAMSYIPGLSTAWGKLPGDQKRTLMGVLILAAGGVVYFGACAEWWGGLVCGDWETLGRAILSALVANQSVYKLTKG